LVAVVVGNQIMRDAIKQAEKGKPQTVAFNCSDP
jgi:hypothetical protein